MITVGIPVYNEERSIAKCINSILKQISKDDEIIIVASGCTDNTVPKIKEVSKKDKRIKLIIEKERKGKSSALNLIIKNAKNKIIVQTDGDIVIKDKAIPNLIKHFKSKEVGAVSGKPVPAIPKKSLFYEWTVMSYRKIHELRKKETEKGTFWHLSGYLLAFRKDVLKKIPFVKGAVDAVMGKIIKDSGYKIIYEPNAKVLVKCPTNIKDFINQKARVRAGYYFLRKKRKDSPRTMKNEIIYLPYELFKIPIRRWYAFFISSFFYAFAWFRGMYLFKRNKSLKDIWKHIGSTK
jgi:glycosyltransferase involved in cell wall biosynthesis